MPDVFGIPNVTLTDAIYEAHTPHAIRDALWKLRGSPEAIPVARVLAIKGYIIDVPIMVWGWSAPLVMATRMADGFQYCASALMGYMPSPGQNLPGAIRVSVDAADYPAIDKPAPPPDTTSMVDVIIVRDKDGNIVSETPNLLWVDPDGTGHFAPGPGAYAAGIPGGIRVHNHDRFTQQGVVYTAEVTDGPWGMKVVHFTAPVTLAA
jgi:hypothetical protein